eukprot:TRINITY_DN19609_c0_g1_i1.p1 TRINITY_DN19609_c0_g1~~TRINITY_DN19609_c0_g1_i1.p1  ORF type:complete len:209 (-),score=48.32 TRINITY_DN19609_c0_g1_i1:47-673(-)
MSSPNVKSLVENALSVWALDPHSLPDLDVVVLVNRFLAAIGDDHGLTQAQVNLFLDSYASLLRSIGSIHTPLDKSLDDACANILEEFEQADGKPHLLLEMGESRLKRSVPAKGRSRFKKQRKGILPETSTELLKGWLFAHIKNPYPSEEEKVQLCTQTGLDMTQIANWFINARRRMLQPLKMLNPKAKKNTPLLFDDEDGEDNEDEEY